MFLFFYIWSLDVDIYLYKTKQKYFNKYFWQNNILRVWNIVMESFQYSCRLIMTKFPYLCIPSNGKIRHTVITLQFSEPAGNYRLLLYGKRWKLKIKIAKKKTETYIIIVYQSAEYEPRYVQWNNSCVHIDIEVKQQLGVEGRDVCLHQYKKSDFLTEPHDS